MILCPIIICLKKYLSGVVFFLNRKRYYQDRTDILSCSQEKFELNQEFRKEINTSYAFKIIH
jgi:hypothetical protein